MRADPWNSLRETAGKFTEVEGGVSVRKDE